MVNACLAKSATVNEAVTHLEAASDGEVGDLRKCLAERPRSFSDAIRWALNKFHRDYNSEIQSLLDKFPADSVSLSSCNGYAEQYMLT